MTVVWPEAFSRYSEVFADGVQVVVELLRVGMPRPADLFDNYPEGQSLLSYRR